MGHVSYLLKPNPPSSSRNETQEEVDKKMKALFNKFSSVFTDLTGKFQDEPTKFQLKSDVSPVIQPLRRAPVHYRERRSIHGASINPATSRAWKPGEHGYGQVEKESNGILNWNVH